MPRLKQYQRLKTKVGKNVVRFLQPFEIYKQGELAGFDDEATEYLEHHQIAVVEKRAHDPRETVLEVPETKEEPKLVKKAKGRRKTKGKTSRKKK